MGIGLSKLAEEDPTFRVRTDENTGQTVISGLVGEPVRSIKTIIIPIFRILYLTDIVNYPEALFAFCGLVIEFLCLF